MTKLVKSNEVNCGVILVLTEVNKSFGLTKILS